jgi:hypothetical protein
MRPESMAEKEILAYLDGSLDESAKEELMHKLAVSPEKRALLEAHLKLRDMLNLAQKPFTAPLEAQRSLAEKLPLLAERLPQLRQVVPAMAAIEETLVAPNAMLAGRSLSFSKLVAEGAFVLVGLLVFFSFSSDAITPVKMSTPVAESLSPRTESGALSNLSATQNTLQKSAETNDQTMQASSNGVLAPLHRSGSASNAARLADVTTVPSARNWPAKNIPSANGHRGSNTANAADQNNVANITTSNVPLAVKGTGDDATSQVGSHSSNSIVQHNDADFASPVFSVKPRDLSSVAPVNSMHASLDPMINIANVPSATANRYSIVASGGTKVSLLSGINDQSARTAAFASEAVGISYALAPEISFGVQFGRSTFGRIEYTTLFEPSSSASLPDRYTVHPAVNSVQAYFGRVQTELSLLRSDIFGVDLVIGAGAALLSNIAPEAALGLAGNYRINDGLTLRVGASAEGAWVRSLVPTNLSIPTTAGVIQFTADKNWLFTPSLNFEIGFQYSIF